MPSNTKALGIIEKAGYLIPADRIRAVHEHQRSMSISQQQREAARRARNKPLIELRHLYGKTSPIFHIDFETRRHIRVPLAADLHIVFPNKMAHEGLTIEHAVRGALKKKGDHYTPHAYSSRVTFTVEEDGVENTRALFNAVTVAARTLLKTDEQRKQFDANMPELIKQFEAYLYYVEHQCLPDDLSTGSQDQAFSQTAYEWSCTPDYIEQQQLYMGMLKAIESREHTVLREILQAGVDPNLTVNGYWSPLVESIAMDTVTTSEEREALLVCFNMLIHYGADTSMPHRPHTTFEPIIDRGVRNGEQPIQNELSLELMRRMASANKAGVPPVIADPFKQSAIGQLASKAAGFFESQQGQCIVKQLIRSVKMVGFTPDFIIKLNMHDGAEFQVRSIKLANYLSNQSLLDQIKKLAEPYFKPIADKKVAEQAQQIGQKAAEEQFGYDVFFSNYIQKCQANAVFDLVIDSDNKLIGFSSYELQQATDGQKVVHLLFACAEVSFSNRYKDVMSVVSMMPVMAYQQSHTGSAPIATWTRVWNHTSFIPISATPIHYPKYECLSADLKALIREANGDAFRCDADTHFMMKADSMFAVPISRSASTHRPRGDGFFQSRDNRREVYQACYMQAERALIVAFESNNQNNTFYEIMFKELMGEANYSYWIRRLPILLQSVELDAGHVPPARL